SELKKISDEKDLLSIECVNYTQLRSVLAARAVIERFEDILPRQYDKDDWKATWRKRVRKRYKC
ncbi:unnamed protein product, partial [Mesorhabditis belari]